MSEFAGASLSVVRVTAIVNGPPAFSSGAWSVPLRGAAETSASAMLVMRDAWARVGESGLLRQRDRVTMTGSGVAVPPRAPGAASPWVFCVGGAGSATLVVERFIGVDAGSGVVGAGGGGGSGGAAVALCGSALLAARANGRDSVGGGVFGEPVSVDDTLLATLDPAALARLCSTGGGRRASTHKAAAIADGSASSDAFSFIDDVDAIPRAKRARASSSTPDSPLVAAVHKLNDDELLIPFAQINSGTSSTQGAGVAVIGGLGASGSCVATTQMVFLPPDAKQGGAGPPSGGGALLLPTPQHRPPPLPASGPHQMLPPPQPQVLRPPPRPLPKAGDSAVTGAKGVAAKSGAPSAAAPPPP